MYTILNLTTAGGSISPAKLIEMSDQFARSTASTASADVGGAGACLTLVNNAFRQSSVEELYNKYLTLL